MWRLSPERVRLAYAAVRRKLLDERVMASHWEGELSSSALSTATAVMALYQVQRNSSSQTGASEDTVRIEAGLRWIAGQQNADGGWGDTSLSVSNISTSMLCHAVYHATGKVGEFAEVMEKSEKYLKLKGGVSAVRARYGKDKTFSVPILTHCALAGLVDWKEITPLPFELACVPHRFYKWLRLPVVSYALPALIAIGQCRYEHRRPWNPILAALRKLAKAPSLQVLERIQPSSGGFLEATPLTSFVVMSLASIGLHNHPVVHRGVEFIRNSVRVDGSWPIDTNLATWVTTLSVNALGPDVPAESRAQLIDWLGRQQYRDVHPYTQADPGGWAWTNLTGGVPDADDTPGAILALLNLLSGNQITDILQPHLSSGKNEMAVDLNAAVNWLLNLQNRDGGFPTFCRGWGALPFDRSAPDITAHCLRAIYRCHQLGLGSTDGARSNSSRMLRSIQRGFRYLERNQRADGSWLPLWFGNQHQLAEENPTYGTARVLLAYEQTAQTNCAAYQNGILWLCQNQNPDGSWGGSKGLPASVEETSVALDTLLGCPQHIIRSPDTGIRETIESGLEWLVDRIEKGSVHQYSPIGFYFAKLWYFEKLYPLAFATQALRRASVLLNDIQ